MVSVPAPQALKAAEVVALHDSRLAAPGTPSRPGAGYWQAMGDNHRNNCILWKQEDLARRRNEPDADIDCASGARTLLQVRL